jgi:hypothetical protein
MVSSAEAGGIQTQHDREASGGTGFEPSWNAYRLEIDNAGVDHRRQVERQEQRGREQLEVGGIVDTRGVIEQRDELGDQVLGPGEGGCAGAPARHRPDGSDVRRGAQRRMLVAPAVAIGGGPINAAPARSGSRRDQAARAAALAPTT